jgi:hypothetical protein
MNAQPSTSQKTPKNLTPSDITWEVLQGCRSNIGELKRLLGSRYEESKEALQETLCDYFNGGNCDYKGMQISPIGATKSGGKCLKVRWALPGGGKSGGLRIAVVGYCDTKRVKLAGMWVRKDDPSDEEFANAVAKA